MRRVTLSTDRDLVVLSAVQWRFGLCSNIKQTTWVYKLRSISGSEVLEGGEGNSFYGSRSGGTKVL